MTFSKDMSQIKSFTIALPIKIPTINKSDLSNEKSYDLYFEGQQLHETKYFTQSATQIVLTPHLNQRETRIERVLEISIESW